jgi:hypothetical protein
VENFQNKWKRLNIKQYTIPEIETILSLGNFDDFTKDVFNKLNSGDTIVKVSMDLTEKEIYGYVSVKRVNKAIKEIKNKIVKLTLLGKLK